MSVRKLIERSIAAREDMSDALHEGAHLLRPDARRPTNRARAGWVPMVDVTESERGFHVSVDLPGVEGPDVHVRISKNRLTIVGTKREASEQRGERPFFRERCFGAFERKILLPSEVDEDHVLVSFRHGVLTVALLKAAQASRCLEASAAGS